MLEHKKPFPCKECPVPELAKQVQDVGCVGTIAIETVLSSRKLRFMPLTLAKVAVEGFMCPWVSSEVPKNFVPTN